MTYEMIQQMEPAFPVAALCEARQCAQAGPLYAPLANADFLRRGKVYQALTGLLPADRSRWWYYSGHYQSISEPTGCEDTVSAR